MTFGKTTLTRRTTQAAFCAAAFSVVGLAVVPQTGWLVRQQLRGGLAGEQLFQELNGTRSSASDRARAQAQTIALAHPADFALRLAAAARPPAPQPPTTSADPGESLTYLAARRVWALRDQFPNEPALYATYLRLACTIGNHGRDLEEEMLTSSTIADAQAKIDKRLNGRPAPPTFWESHPDQLADLAEAAQRGENLDPGNAYFALMSARAAFAAHQDDDALNALGRAGAGTHFNSYCMVEPQATLKLDELQYGKLGTLSQTAVMASVLFPDLAQFRSAARIAVAKAILAEQSGDTARGFKIRHDLARTGALMRQNGSTLIHSLVGISLTQISGSRPGGEPPLTKSGDDEEGTALAKERQAHYIAYLNHIGHKEEARWFAEETQRGEAVKSIAKDGVDRSILGGPALTWILAWWGVCFALLATTIWMLIGGGVGALVARGARVRDAAPLHFAARRAFAALFIAPIVGVVACLPFGSPTGLGVLAISLLGLIAPIFFLWRNPTGTGRELTGAQARHTAVQSVKIYGKVVGLTLATLALLGASVPAIASMAAATTVFQVYSTSVGNTVLQMLSPAYFFVGACVFSLSGLLAVTIGSLVWSLKRRTPASIGLALGFRNLALPVATLWLVLYAFAAAHTAALEAQADQEMSCFGQHEGKYIASLIDRSWPNKTPENL